MLGRRVASRLAEHELAHGNGMARPLSNIMDLEISDRHSDILTASAALFAERGYSATSMREIGERVGLLGGSLYHHIRSKEALFIRVHDLALQRAADQVRSSLPGIEDPWDRLRIACLNLLELQLDPASLTVPLMNDLDAVPPQVRPLLIAKRDEFESIFVALVKDLPLPPAVDRSIYRIALLTLLNRARSWYQPGRLSISDIADQVVGIFRHETDEPVARISRPARVRPPVRAVR